MCAGRRATFSQPKITQRRPLPQAGTPVFAVKGESLEDYWDYTDQYLLVGR